MATNLADKQFWENETREPWNPDPARFEMSFACETCRLERRA